jgi:hypothetical protein
MPAERLNMQVGGPAWTSCYDAALGRMALHDDLSDLAQAGNGVVGDALAYVVAGWWSDPRRDPLDGVGTLDGYHARLRSLGWDDVDHPGPSQAELDAQKSADRTARSFGIPRAGRYADVTPGDTVLEPAVSRFITDSLAAARLPAAPTRATLLHGRIHGVPLNDQGRPDDRPSAKSLGVALGPSAASVTALLASGALTEDTTPEAQQDAQRLIEAFTSGLLDRIERPDTWAELAHHAHAHAFGARPGGVEAVDRLVDRPTPGADPGSGSRPAERATAPRETIDLPSTVLWSPRPLPAVIGRGPAAAVSRKVDTRGTDPRKPKPKPKAPAAPAAREAPRPAPAFHVPAAPVLAISGAARLLGAVERDEADGQLIVRTSTQGVKGVAGLLPGAELLPGIASGAIPEEVLALAREALVEDPYLLALRLGHLAERGVGGPAVHARLQAESALNFAYYAGRDRELGDFTRTRVDSAATRQEAVEALLRHSMVEGVLCHPEGVTHWGQPWRPLFCDWSVELELELAGLGALLAHRAGFTLGEADLEIRKALDLGADAHTVAVSGRSVLQTTVGQGLTAALDRYLENERLRDEKGVGLASEEVETALAELRDHLASLDVLSVSLDGLRERLLGLAYDRGLLRRAPDGAPADAAVALAVAAPQLLAAGRLRLVQARLVDAFGRTLDVPVEATRIAAEAADDAAGMYLPPRLQAPARLHLKLVDPLGEGAAAAAARVDQKDRAAQVNPVVGFLLPDHIDEALEIFDVEGVPLGQVAHEATSDAVFWEGAPGRTDIGPADGPLADGTPLRRRLGFLAAGLSAADAADRQARPEGSPRKESESALSALLRAVDTTLWTVDPLGALGREHIAGLVGRPIAVVTAQLTLEVQPDLDELAYGDSTSREAPRRRLRRAAGRALPGAPGLGHPRRRRPAGLLRRRRLPSPACRRPHHRHRGPPIGALPRPLGAPWRAGQGAHHAPVHHPRRDGHVAARTDAAAHPADASRRQGPLHVRPGAADLRRAGPGLARGPRAPGPPRCAWGRCSSTPTRSACPRSRPSRWTSSSRAGTAPEVGATIRSSRPPSRPTSRIRPPRCRRAGSASTPTRPNRPSRGEVEHGALQLAPGAGLQ